MFNKGTTRKAIRREIRMPRPPKCRTIEGQPRVTRYKPSGIPARLLETVVLGLDELEAIRLADADRLYQEDAAKRMGISRPTFGRLVAEARHKVADALFNGKALVFSGGAVAVAEAGPTPEPGRRGRGGHGGGQGGRGHGRGRGRSGPAAGR